jgi:hypothetical protein
MTLRINNFFRSLDSKLTVNLEDLFLPSDIEAYVLTNLECHIAS